MHTVSLIRFKTDLKQNIKHIVKALVITVKIMPNRRYVY